VTGPETINIIANCTGCKQRLNCGVNIRFPIKEMRKRNLTEDRNLTDDMRKSGYFCLTCELQARHYKIVRVA